MRAWLTLVLFSALAVEGWAQESDPKKPEGEQPKADAGEAKKEAGKEKEPELWRMPEKEAKKVQGLLEDYLHPGKKSRADIQAKFDKLISKPVDGHSPLEDVAAFVGMANELRIFNTKLKKGRVQEVRVGPEVHGFPGGVGTVAYWLYLPKDYDYRTLWPLLFCMPDNKKHVDGKKFIEDSWVNLSPTVAERFIVVVPQPERKGDPWTSPKSLARAMISLRHACGTFDADKKTGGPAVDLLRLFIEGDDAAATVAGRFPEMFAGAILHDTDGHAANGPDLRAAGRLTGLPAYVVYDPKRKSQVKFAESLKRDNPACQIEDGTKVGPVGNPKSIAMWMEKLAPRNHQPRRFEYFVHESSFQRHFWITVLAYDAAIDPAASVLATADRAKNEVRVEVAGVSRFELFLNDALVDLSKPIKIVVIENEKEIPLFWKSEDGTDTASRDLATMLDELVSSNHPWRIYPVKYVVDVPTIRAKAAEKAAAEKAE